MFASRVGTRLASISTPVPDLEVGSQVVQVSPAAPISCMPSTAPVSMASSVASISSFSIKGSPICTFGRFSSWSSPRVSEAKVAPWMPSRPVLAPTYIAALPGTSARADTMRSNGTTPTAIAFTSGLPE
jgi:hypothetical protein